MLHLIIKGFIELLPFYLIVPTIVAQEWSLQTKISPEGLDPLDNVGISIAISDSFMIIGAWSDDMNDQGGRINETGALYLYH